MNVVWSPLARKNFDNLIIFLEQKWEPKVITKLFEELEEHLNIISQNPHFFPLISKKKQFRKCILRRRTILIYRIIHKERRVEIVTVVDARVDPKKYKF